MSCRSTNKYPNFRIKSQHFLALNISYFFPFSSTINGIFIKCFYIKDVSINVNIYILEKYPFLTFTILAPNIIDCFIADIHNFLKFYKIKNKTIQYLDKHLCIPLLIILKFVWNEVNNHQNNMISSLISFFYIYEVISVHNRHKF